MEEVMSALRKLQQDMDQQKITIERNGEKVTEQITENINKTLDTKFRIWEDSQEKLLQKIEKQEQRLHTLEKQVRQRNLVFFGIEENEKSYSQLETNIIDFINNFLSIKLNNIDIQEARRIGKKSENPRPITVTFTTLGSKIKIIKQKGLLKDTAYYIKEDYPQHILEKRRELQEQAQVEKNKGNKVIIKYDKLIVLKNNSETESSSDTRKRNLSISPQNNLNSQVYTPQPTRNIQLAKKNKTVVTRNTSQSSPSTSQGPVKPGILNFLTNKQSNGKQEGDKIEPKTT
ncbi:uncharacterized protein LOC133534148 [Cydia pomonella]|uniref:uncharacterized protein LOC133534148 n=1 Tax=Cydia pomonella TaxID=82600 RepID=UPI002ADD9B37|nr:uncharacterized protein LOC133534148 [Cydia pomonella]